MKVEDEQRLELVSQCCGVQLLPRAVHIMNYIPIALLAKRDAIVGWGEMEMSFAMTLKRLKISIRNSVGAVND